MFWNSKILLFVILAPTIHFISLVNGLNCLECITDECRKGDKDNPPISITCEPNEYCSKTLYGNKDVQRRCYSKQELHNSNLRLNECGEHDDGSGNNKICICDDTDNCNSGYDFILSPTGLKCLECTSMDCRHGIVKPTTISCKKGYYCEKFSYIENNTKLIYRDCREQEYLLFYKLKLNDCGILEDRYDRKLPTCYCNKDGCNSGNNFEPKPNSDPPGIECQKCDDDTECLDEGHKIDKCEIGYICYKLFEIQSNVTRVVKRGCIHKEYSSDFGLQLNQCGQFTNSNNEKQPICICDKNKCNSGGWPAEIENPEKTPSPNSATIYFNPFFVMSIIFIGFIQY